MLRIWVDILLETYIHFLVSVFCPIPAPGQTALCPRAGPQPSALSSPFCVGRFLACPSLFEPPCLSLCLYAHFFISSSASRQPPKKIWDYTPGDCSILPREDRKVIPCLLRGLGARPLALGAVSVLWVSALFLNLSFLLSFFFFNLVTCLAWWWNYLTKSVRHTNVYRGF